MPSIDETGFWKQMVDAFRDSEGFTVIFHLTSGHSFNVSLREPDWDRLRTYNGAFLEGTNIATGNAITIPIGAIVAYEIEE